VARTRFNDYGPLLRLKQYGEARRLLYGCLAVFESDGSSAQIGMVHTAIADLEDDLEHFPEAVRHESAALRYTYSILSPNDCAGRHFNLAIYLMRNNAHSREALAHCLAASLIRYQMNHGKLPDNIHAVRQDLAQLNAIDVPASFDEVCDLVEQTEGVRFRELFLRLPKRAASGDEALQAVLAMARTAEEEPEMPEPLQAIFEAAAAGQDVEPMLTALQEQLAGRPEADQLIAQLRAALASTKAKAEGVE
jgi:hypothetical protein